MSDFLRNNRYFIIIMCLLIYLASRKYMDNNQNDTWIMPVKGVITQGFHLGKLPEHHGIDLALSLGEPVHASQDGTISFSGEKGVYGNCIMISHGDGSIITLYGHNSKLLVKVGDKVKQGDVIALGGSSGFSTGNHCHWEYRVNNIYENPLNHVKNSNNNQAAKDSELDLQIDPNALLPENIDDL